VENLLSELTEDRIQDMLEGKDLSDSSPESENEAGEETSENENNEVSKEGTETVDLDDTDLSSKRNHSPIEGDEGGNNSSKRTKTDDL
jgi:hypothetical protein